MRVTTAILLIAAGVGTLAIPHPRVTPTHGPHTASPAATSIVEHATAILSPFTKRVVEVPSLIVSQDAVVQTESRLLHATHGPVIDRRSRSFTLISTTLAEPTPTTTPPPFIDILSPVLTPNPATVTPKLHATHGPIKRDISIEMQKRQLVEDGCLKVTCSPRLCVCLEGSIQKRGQEHNECAVGGIGNADCGPIVGEFEKRELVGESSGHCALGGHGSADCGPVVGPIGVEKRELVDDAFVDCALGDIGSVECGPIPGPVEADKRELMDDASVNCALGDINSADCGPTIGPVDADKRELVDDESVDCALGGIGGVECGPILGPFDKTRSIEVQRRQLVAGGCEPIDVACTPDVCVCSPNPFA